jgi:antitoxin component of MazEF toxin-antitoxin module
MVPMPTIKLHYDGWMALPAGLRQALGLNSGDRLKAELVDGALVLRPVAKTRYPAPRGETAAPVSAKPAETLPLAGATTPARRKPGRPRKSTAITGEAAAAAAPKRTRGRPRRVAPAQDTATAVSPAAVLGPSKLLKKAELEGRATPPDVAATRPARSIRPDRAPQPVERRPFRNVEVRPLGPGRGHNKRHPGRTSRP